MTGYQRVLQDFWLKNELIDIDLVNLPDDIPAWELVGARSPESKCSRFVFAAHVPPGIHHFVIYCPKTKRVFVKEVVVGLSAKDFCWPELP